MLESVNKVLRKAATIVLAEEEHGNKELEELRLEKCENCPHFQAGNRTCGVCGCFMDVKAKLTTHKNPAAGMRTEITHCPRGKWGDLHIANLYLKMDGKPLLTNFENLNNN